MLIKNKLITRFHCGLMTYPNEKMFDFESVVLTLDEIIASGVPVCGEYGFVPAYEGINDVQERMNRVQVVKDPAVAIKNINYRVVTTNDGKFKTVYVYGDIVPLNDDAATLLTDGSYKFEWRTLVRTNHLFRQSLIKLVALDIFYK